jgi:hypothetical protein
MSHARESLEHAGSEACLLAIGEHLREVRGALEQPSVVRIDQCREELQKMVGILQGIPRQFGELPANRDGVLAGALAARRELRRIRDLLESAAGFHQGWRQFRATFLSGYTAQGAPAAVPGTHRLSLSG